MNMKEDRTDYSVVGCSNFDELQQQILDEMKTGLTSKQFDELPRDERSKIAERAAWIAAENLADTIKDPSDLDEIMKAVVRISMMSLIVMGVVKVGDTYGGERLVAAFKSALELYGQVLSILARRRQQ